MAKHRTERFSVVRFVVEGTGTFPVDMLRHDRCFPWTEADSNAAERQGSRRQVALEHRGNGDLTPRRWQSFGWTIVSEDRG